MEGIVFSYGFIPIKLYNMRHFRRMVYDLRQENKSKLFNMDAMRDGTEEFIKTEWLLPGYDNVTGMWMEIPDEGQGVIVTLSWLAAGR